MPFYEFEGHVPRISESSYIHEEAVLIGKVFIGGGCYIAAGAVLRGDWGEIIVGDGSNIQENVVIHARPESVTRLGNDSHVGHGAILHGCTLEEHVLVGMGAILNDDVVVGDNTVIASGALLPPRMEVPPRSLVIGVPATVVREVSDEQNGYFWLGTRLYQTLPERYRSSCRMVAREDCLQ